VVDFTKSFHNGMTLCALIHHFRPKLINYDALNPANSIDNLKVAFNGMYARSVCVFASHLAFC
jgi:hypothetical protein